MRTKGGQEGGLWHRSQLVAIDVLLFTNFAVFFNFHGFPFTPSKAKAQYSGNVPMTGKRGELFVSSESKETKPVFVNV
jgi:hypothetical protein